MKKYTRADITQAEIALESSKKKWMSNIQIYQKHGKRLDRADEFHMGFSEHIRRIAATTNAVEALQPTDKESDQNKGIQTTDKSLIKQIYLILTYGKGGWKRMCLAGKIIAKELQEKFGERYERHLMIKTMLKGLAPHAWKPKIDLKVVEFL